MNHLVSRADVEEEQPSLRASQAAATRRRIVDGLLAVLAEDHPATLSVPAVARRAGVSVATVYRYFPTKEALLDAGSEVTDQLIEQSGGPDGLDGLEALLLRISTAFLACGGAAGASPGRLAARTGRSGAVGCFGAWSCCGPRSPRRGSTRPAPRASA